MTQLSIEENIADGFNMMTAVEDAGDYIMSYMVINVVVVCDYKYYSLL